MQNRHQLNELNVNNNNNEIQNAMETYEATEKERETNTSARCVLCENKTGFMRIEPLCLYILYSVINM